MYSSILDAVKQHSLETPDKVAVIDATNAYTYLEFYTQVRRVAYNLSKLGVVKGDYVVVECVQSARYLLLDLACESLEAIFVPVEKKAVESRVSDIYTETGAKFIISVTDYSALGKRVDMDTMFEDNGCIDEHFPDTNQLAEILYSTGTTGKPKGIMISHRANVAVAENIMYGVEMGKDSVEMIPMPLSHSHGLRTCYANLVNGSTVAIIDGVLNVGALFKMIETYKVNAMDISPTLGKLLIKIAKKGLEEISSNIDYIEIGTAVLDDEVKEDLKAIFPKARLYNFYGSTEAGRSCALNFNKEDFSKCIGYPSRHAKFIIVDDNKKQFDATAENPGLVAVSGSMMMDGYFNAPELTAETVIDGVIYTTDLGYIDADGRVYVFGRADDVINYKGIKISPEEIETVAAEYEGVTDCACVPVADKMCGQAPKLFISVDKDDFDKKAYIKYLKANLESSRVPVAIEIIDLIPRTSNGKLQRKKLREA